MGPYLGKYAFKMLLRQHELATGPNASYETSNADNGVTILTNTKIGESHEVNARRYPPTENAQRKQPATTAIQPLQRRRFQNLVILPSFAPPPKAKGLSRQEDDELARWDDFGFTTHGQVKLMAHIIKARNNFKIRRHTSRQSTSSIYTSGMSAVTLSMALSS
ncbi:hypothetical protein F444_01978 [Phytophthora nicotianae P1976]|uniref:Uncharacterized protein n=1 Tax=Phytophthora nicotianae P1976 TaxID=1317066 RepID=A0A081AYX6_PHYNI|nr:hypothetical protein F444_01978 [Phytophthora nicotianae P1976]